MTMTKFGQARLGQPAVLPDEVDRRGLQHPDQQAADHRRTDQHETAQGRGGERRNDQRACTTRARWQ